MAAYFIDQFNQTPLPGFRTLFRSFPPPTPDSLQGLYRARFVGPGWLRAAAGPALATVGLGNWWGKEFYGEGHGVNVVIRRGVPQRLFPMSLSLAPSLIDGVVGVTVTYSSDCPFPWPWVVDELRRLDRTTLLGLSLMKAGPLRHIAFPFLLTYQEHFDGI